MLIIGGSSLRPRPTLTIGPPERPRGRTREGSFRPEPLTDTTRLELNRTTLPMTVATPDTTSKPLTDTMSVMRGVATVRDMLTTKGLVLAGGGFTATNTARRDPAMTQIEMVTQLA